MWYVIIVEDTPNNLQKHITTKPKHLTHLQQLQDKTTIIIPLTINILSTLPYQNLTQPICTIMATITTTMTT
jgi:Uncharacterized protein conserved in bacteria